MTDDATPTHGVTHTEAATILVERDPVVAGLVAEFGPPDFRPPHDTHFAALVRAVTYQQLAGKAAEAIHGRLVTTLGGDVSPEALAAATTEALRAAGLSGNKAASLQDLAAKALDGTVALGPGQIDRQSDQELIDHLCLVRGIGPWTAQMFLMFQLRRLDVWPTGDFGVRKGYGLAWQIPMPTPKQLEPLGDPYRPYRSIVAWYCWRAVERTAGSPASAVTGADTTT